MKKLLLTSFLAIIMATATYAAPALIPGSTTVYWEIIDNTLYITGIGDMPDFEQNGSPWHSNRNAITKLDIAVGITAIGDYALYDCGNLTVTLVIPNNVKTIGYRAFFWCSKLAGLVLGSAVEAIGEYAFYDCAGLTGTLVIPDNVKTIGRWAFGSCSNLEGLVLGGAVETIGDWTFYDCKELKSITALPATPPVVANDNAFDGSPAWAQNCTLYVPVGSEEAYKTAIGWNLFATNTYTGITSATVSDLKVSVENGVIIITGITQPQVSVFDMQGRQIFSGITNRIEISQTGVYVVNIGNKAVKVVI